MTQSKDTKNNNQGMNPVAAAVTGAVVGAGVAVAGAVALHDEKNREKVKQVLSDVKDQALGYMEDMQHMGQEKQKEIQHAVKNGKKQVKKLADTRNKT